MHIALSPPNSMMETIDLVSTEHQDDPNSDSNDSQTHTIYDTGMSLAKKKKIADKETLVHTGWRGGKRNPLFIAYQKGDIFLWGEGSKPYCCVSQVHFCVSVPTQFVAFLEALHHENFLSLVIKLLT